MRCHETGVGGGGEKGIEPGEGACVSWQLAWNCCSLGAGSVPSGALCCSDSRDTPGSWRYTKSRRGIGE